MDGPTEGMTTMSDRGAKAASIRRDGGERHVRRMCDDLAAQVEQLDLALGSLIDKLVPAMRQSEDVRAMPVSMAGEVPEGASSLALELSGSVRRLAHMTARIEGAREAVEL